MAVDAYSRVCVSVSGIWKNRKQGECCYLEPTGKGGFTELLLRGKGRAGALLCFLSCSFSFSPSWTACYSLTLHLSYIFWHFMSEIFSKLKLRNPYPCWAFRFCHKYFTVNEQRTKVSSHSPASASQPLHQPHPFSVCHSYPWHTAATCPQSGSWSSMETGLGWKREVEEPAAALGRADRCWHLVALPWGLFPAASACFFFWGFVQPSFRCLKQHIFPSATVLQSGHLMVKAFPYIFLYFFSFFFFFFRPSVVTPTHLTVGSPLLYFLLDICYRRLLICQWAK